MDVILASHPVVVDIFIFGVLGGGLIVLTVCLGIDYRLTRGKKLTR